MPSPVVVAQTRNALVLVGRQQREQRRGPPGIHVGAVIDTPHIDIQWTGRGKWARPDRRQVVERWQHVHHGKVRPG